MSPDRITAALLVAATAHSGLVSASTLHNNPRASHDLDLRALPDSPSGGYAPKVVTCPSTAPTVRSAASGLSQNETAFLNRRRAATLQPMADFISRTNISGFDAQSYINSYASNVSALPNIAIAVSGGGYRALMNGAGFLAAADNRTAGSTDDGGIGGLLQASTYVAGLSGGGWLVGSIYNNNFSSVEAIMANTGIWQFQNSIFEGPDDGVIGVLDTAEYWDNVYDQVGEKSDAGFDTTITDYWGRALSYQLINAPDGGPAYTWSSIGLDADLIAGNIPMPFLVADGRNPGEQIVSLNATNYELGPWEMGTWDPTVYGFVPMQYVGSNFSDGSITSGGSCVEGFDQSGFVMGTSSTLFNQFLLTNLSTVANVPSVVVNALDDLLKAISENEEDIALWVPNSFNGYNPTGNSPVANTTQLSLVDGGEDLQNIPLNPLQQPERAVDVIFAVDSSADTTYNWPNGTALRATYDRSQSAIANNTLFPPVPDANTFINLGLNARPAFFGCDVSNFTLAAGQAIPPLVVYMPNAPYTAFSNVSTFDPSYSLDQRNSIITNGLNAATQGNATLDADWPACVACAALSRSLTRTGTTVPSTCTTCFTRYCWNGTLDTTDNGAYEPEAIIGNVSATSDSSSRGTMSGLEAERQMMAVKVMVGFVAVFAFSGLMA
ncbi:lysophospholipase [Coniella lustricola]|uniref:Lysophospholipase n=1 Tax=Coniella lustricola TaxID=2025994 RepID=A0A2T3A1W6_9PEZI|nr:lysophospholipase [Coniella lustricola]